MPPKTIRKAISNTLEDLSRRNFDKFCVELVDRKEEPRVRRSKVEDKSFLVVAEVLVSTFTETRAAAVTAEILREIECDEEADRLLEVAREINAKPGSSDHAVKHFVDKHKDELIQRVSNIAPILDNLLTRKVVSEEIYDEIRVMSTTQKKMRELFSGPLRAGGASCKDIFYQLLEEHEAFLVEDLKNK